jgi:hypothetical protein
MHANTAMSRLQNRTMLEDPCACHARSMIIIQEGEWYSIVVPNKGPGGRPTCKAVFAQDVKDEMSKVQLARPLYLFLGFTEANKTSMPSSSSGINNQHNPGLDRFVANLQHHVQNETKRLEKKNKREAAAKTAATTAAVTPTNKPDHDLLKVSL